MGKLPLRQQNALTTLPSQGIRTQPLRRKNTSPHLISRMYGDAFDHYLDRCQPGSPDLLPARARWPRRALGLALLGLLVVMHACG